MPINERIIMLIEWTGKSIPKFAESVGLKKATVYLMVKDKTKPSFETLVSILKVHSKISPDWLLMNTGSMLRVENSIQNIVKEPSVNYESGIISILQRELEMKNKQLTDSQQHITELLKKIDG